MASGTTVKKRIAIVGAGCSGLTAIKSCLDEGLEPMCLEKSADIGGLWNFTDKIQEGSASIYRSLVINTSKDMMMFSDFPPPEDFPPFLTHAKVLEYFRLYVDAFDLLRHIRFETEVYSVTKAEDYDVTGRWNVAYRKKTRFKSAGDYRKTEQNYYEHDEADNDDDGDVDDDDVEGTRVIQEVFDGVMICTGHHSVPYMPSIPGLDTFEGVVFHSHSYKDSSPFHGKKVVILGMGNSAVDIACDLSKSAQQVHLSSRRGAWIVPRTAFWGLPADMLANSRVVFTMPYKLLDWCVQLQANFRIDHDTYGLRPHHGVLNCHPTINDELPIHLVSGRIQTKPNIARVDKNCVWFDDDTHCFCDVIILATGYDYRVDFVDPEVLKVQHNRATLYKYMFPPHLPHPTLGVIGLIQAIGAVMPISEMQSRWFTRLQTGTVKLPTRQEMEADIENKQTAMSQLYVQSRRHTMQTFWIEYMDQVASQIGARPNLWKILCTDPELALKCYLGPCLPAQYRLTGPGRWSGARGFIVNALTRATKSRSASSGIRSKSAPQARPSPWPRQRRAVVSTGGDVVGHLAEDADSLDMADGSRTLVMTEETADSGGDQTEAAAGEERGQLSPEWKTFSFYIAVMIICCFAWLLSVLYSQAESLLNVVDRRLPLSD